MNEFYVLFMPQFTTMGIPLRDLRFFSREEIAEHVKHRYESMSERQ